MADIRTYESVEIENAARTLYMDTLAALDPLIDSGATASTERMSALAAVASAACNGIEAEEDSSGSGEEDAPPLASSLVYNDDQLRVRATALYMKTMDLITKLLAESTVSSQRLQSLAEVASAASEGIAIESDDDDGGF